MIILFDNKRLTECYNKALKNKDIIEIDDQTKIIFFSDCHRGDGSLSDEFTHNQNIFIYALEDYLKNGYTYMELGDGDELWEYDKFEHIRIAHSDVFCVLKKYYEADKFYYFYGNHNAKFRNKKKADYALTCYFDEYTDENTVLFPYIDVKESMILRDKITKKEILAVHGHQGDFPNDKGWILSLVFMKIFWRYMHKVGFQNPSSPSRNLVKRHKIEKNFSKWIRSKKIGILCGHTHRPKLPDIDEAAYMNTGCCIHPRGITGIELIGREFFLVHWNVVADDKGFLSIKKKIMQGPYNFDQM